MRDLPYPSKVVETHSKGRALVATSDLVSSVVVERFQGPVVTYAEISDDKVCHAICVGKTADDDRWLVSDTNAIYANHSCDPNCVIGEDVTIITKRSVAEGDELTFSYNRLAAGEAAADFFWDERWNFDCKCGAPKCQGAIDRYR